MSRELIFTCEKHVGVITINRSKSLNALTLPMISALLEQLKNWEMDDRIHAVVICSAEKGVFCAGGDVRWLYDAGLKKDPKQLDFFKEEYELNQYIYDYAKPYIALMDGITMGGGVGISLYASHSVASENFLFAMPETGIGFFPDIGASYLLARCPDNFGMYLGLTGSRLNAIDALNLGLVKYAVNANDFSNILSSIIETDLSFSAHEKVTDCLQKFIKPNLQSAIEPIRMFVKEVFKERSVKEIIASLQKTDDKWHRDIYSQLKKKSPLSLMVTLKQILTATDKTLAEVLKMDSCLVAHFMQDKDFYEGVRALLVDKDKEARWCPNSLDDVTSEMVDKYFVCGEQVI